MPRVRHNGGRAHDDPQHRDSTIGAGNRRKTGRPASIETECKARLDKVIALLEAIAYQGTGYVQEKEAYLAGVYHAIRQRRSIPRQNHQRRQEDSVGVSGQGNRRRGEEPGDGSDPHAC